MFKKILTTILFLLAFLVAAPVSAQVTFPNRGGTGTSTIPAIGQVLGGFINGTYGPLYQIRDALGQSSIDWQNASDNGVDFPLGIRITGDSVLDMNGNTFLLNGGTWCGNDCSGSGASGNILQGDGGNFGSFLNGTLTGLLTTLNFVSTRATTTALTISGIASGNQCLQAGSTGIVSGTGVACGTGSGSNQFLTNAPVGQLSTATTTDGVRAAFLNATSTTATSTFAHTIILTNFIASSSNAAHASSSILGSLNIGTTTRPAALSVNGLTEFFNTTVPAWHSSATVRIGLTGTAGLLIEQQSGATAGDYFRVNDQFGGNQFAINGSTGVFFGGSNRVGTSNGFTGGPSLNYTGLTDYNWFNSNTGNNAAVTIVDSTLPTTSPRTVPVVRFSSTGSVGGSSPLLTNSTGGINIVFNTDKGLDFLSYNSTSSTYVNNLSIRSNNTVGIASSTPAATLGVSGSGYFGGNLTATGTLTVTPLSTGCLQSTSGVISSTGVACASGAGSGGGFIFGAGFIYNATTTDLVGIGSSTPYSTLSVTGKADTIPFTVASTTGKMLFQVNSDGTLGVNGTTTIKFNTTDNNTFIGSRSGNYFASGAVSNTAVGYASCTGSSTASTNAADNNTCLGYGAGFSLTTGADNTLTGYASGQNLTSAAQNTAYGALTLGGNTSTAVTGVGNLTIGWGAAKAITSGASNSVGGGINAGFSLTTGSRNTCWGYTCLGGVATGDANVSLGYFAGRWETGSNAFYVNNIDQSNTANDKAFSLMYGTFGGVAGSIAGNALTINASTTLSATTTVATGAAYVGQSVCYAAGGRLGHQTAAELTAGTCNAN